MRYNISISIFKKHLIKLNQANTDFDVWLATAIELVQDNFSITSQQYSSITQIKNEYNFAKIRDDSRDMREKYAEKIKQLIENFIEQLEGKERIATLEAAQKSEATANRENSLKQKLETLTSNNNFLSSEKHRLEQELSILKNQPKSKRKLLSAINGVYHINASLFWGVILTVLGGCFWFGYYVGTTKFDKNLNDLTDSTRQYRADIVSLKETIKSRENSIEFLRHTSDSALTILSNMPYKEMNLDSVSFRKVQTTIENAGGVLYLNKNYAY